MYGAVVGKASTRSLVGDDLISETAEFCCDRLGFIPPRGGPSLLDRFSHKP